MRRTSQQSAEAFFESLDEAITETPGEKEARIADHLETQRNKHQEKLRTIAALAGKSVEVPIKLIDVSENVREQIDTESPGFQALIADIKASDGVLQQPVVAVLERQGELRLVCLAGHRRILAAQKAGYKTVLTSVRKVDSELQHLSMSLAENLVREDLHPLDVARGFSRLKALGCSHEELAERFGKNVKTVGHFIKMHDEWPPQARTLIRANPERFNASFLLRLAKRRLSSDDVLDVLSAALGGNVRLTKPTRAAQLERYFVENLIPKRDQKIISDAFAALKLL